MTTRPPESFFTDAAAVIAALEKIERGDHSWGDASAWRDLLDRFTTAKGPAAWVRQSVLYGPSLCRPERGAGDRELGGLVR